MGKSALQHKPAYLTHRRHQRTGVPPLAADTLVLADLLVSNGRGAANAKGYGSLHGFVAFDAGTAPSVTLQPLELVGYVDAAGDAQQRLVVRGSNIGPLSAVAGVGFDLDTPGGGRWLFRIHAVTGTPDGVEVYLSGGVRENEGSI